MAIIARVFRLDPVGLLDDHGDDFGHLVRLACAEYIADREADEAARAEQKAKAAARA